MLFLRHSSIADAEFGPTNPVAPFSYSVNNEDLAGILRRCASFGGLNQRKRWKAARKIAFANISDPPIQALAGT
jgi:hypothetical protein